MSATTPRITMHHFCCLATMAVKVYEGRSQNVLVYYFNAHISKCPPLTPTASSLCSLDKKKKQSSVARNEFWDMLGPKGSAS